MAFGSKNSTPSFVLTLPFDISLNEQDYLYKEFKKCGVIYNQLVSATTKMWHQLRKTRKYRELMAAIAKAAPDSKEQKVLLKQRQEMIKSCKGHRALRRKKLALNPGDLVSLNGEILVVHGTHTKKNGSVNVEFKTPSRGGKKSASLKKLKIVKTSNSMHSAWKKVS